MKIIKFCMHNRAKSECVVYEDEGGKQRITDGLGDWECTSERMKNLTDISTIDVSAIVEKLEIPRAFLYENALSLAALLKASA